MASLKRGGDFFAPASQKQSRKSPEWRVIKKPVGEVLSTAIVRIDKDSPASNLIAAFDMDGTLVKTKSGADFARHENDWQFLNGHVVDTLRRLNASGYKICVFSNQAGIKTALEGKTAQKCKGYCDALLRAAGVPACAVLAPAKDGFRKGSRAMWDLVMAQHNGGVVPDLARSFFVGDAAGRDGDHSDVDKRFAENVGLRFFTPEEVFCDTWEVLATLPQGAEAAAEGAAAPVAETVEATAAVAVVVTGEEGAAAAGGAVLVDEAVVVVEAAAAGGEAEGGSA